VPFLREVFFFEKIEENIPMDLLSNVEEKNVASFAVVITCYEG
jgi:hypothetical protein